MVKIIMLWIGIGIIACLAATWAGVKAEAQDHKYGLEVWEVGDFCVFYYGGHITAVPKYAAANQYGPYVGHCK